MLPLQSSSCSILKLNEMRGGGGDVYVRMLGWIIWIREITQHDRANTNVRE